MKTVLFFLFAAMSSYSFQAQQIIPLQSGNQMSEGVDREQNIRSIKMTISGARLYKPTQQESGEQLIYGLALPMQISSIEVVLVVNIRNTGVSVVDFENGFDIVIFNDLTK